jgi:type II secretory pathway pseudopilin PulG
MRDTAAHCSYVGSRAAVSLRGPDSASSTKRRRIGFTLIEAVVAIAILMIVVAGTFSAVSFASSASAVAEGLNTGKNIANYTLEFIRSRNVTRQDTHGFTSWYPGSGSSAGYGLPGIIDLAGEPLAINSCPLLSGAAVGADRSHSPYDYSSLQGYVSLWNTATILSSSSDDPLESNANVKVAGVGTERRYVDAITSDPYVVRFPFDSVSASPPAPAPILAFTAWSDYHKLVSGTWQPNVWGLYLMEGAYTDPHCTTASGRQAACTSYRGYRVLTQIRALTTATSSTGYDHVQTYDVRVTVLWMVGAKERNYVISSTIATY